MKLFSFRKRLPPSYDSLSEIERFQIDKKVVPYSARMLTREDAMSFLNLLNQLGKRTYGFDGFHRRLDISPKAIQIDQIHSLDVSNLSSEDAHMKCLDFLKKEETEENMLYEVVYDDEERSLEVIKAYEQQRAIRTEDEIQRDIKNKKYL